jgi:hypothetical protein
MFWQCEEGTRLYLSSRGLAFSFSEKKSPICENSQKKKHTGGKACA